MEVFIEYTRIYKMRRVLTGKHDKQNEFESQYRVLLTRTLIPRPFHRPRIKPILPRKGEKNEDI